VKGLVGEWEPRKEEAGAFPLFLGAMVVQENFNQHKIHLIYQLQHSMEPIVPHVFNLGVKVWVVRVEEEKGEIF